MKTVDLLICTDLDRTLIPNGSAPESPLVRKLFARFCALPGVILTYVSGRHPELVEEAVKNYSIPQPDYLITDVGTQIMVRQELDFLPMGDWEQLIGADWISTDKEHLARLLGPAKGLRRQEKERENPYKLSYYVNLEENDQSLAQAFAAKLKKNDLPANVVWSIDPLKNLGLLDVLPKAANKLKAIEFLLRHLKYQPEHMLFAGDSGNDLDVFLSPLKSVVVANAEAAIKTTSISKAEEKGISHSLYIAGGNFLGFNGNYAAGILEGTTHFFPWVKEILEAELREIKHVGNSS